MIIGIGVDIVEIERIRNVANRTQFIKKILSEEEIELYKAYQHPKRQLEFLAGRFAAKEAYSKALGTGIGEIGFSDISVVNDERGKPYIKCLDQDQNLHVSITHSDDYAVAMVVIETKDK